MSAFVQETYTRAHDAVSTVAFPFVANAVFIKATVDAAASLTLYDGTTVTIGAQSTGTIIPLRCTVATFASGDIIALA